MNRHLQQMIERAPLSPGVYLFKGKEGKVLYVGKAKRLRDRLRSYKEIGRDERPSIPILLPQVREIEWLITDNEKEALLLEHSLIRTHRPRYNIMFRDDKSYVRLRFTSHPYPRLFITRKVIDDGSAYFGPYSSVADVKKTLNLLQKLFQIRDCSDNFFRNRSRPCLQHQIKRCSAPCVQRISLEDYGIQVEQAKRFLRGDRDSLMQNLKESMKTASKELRYEDALVLRDRVRAMEEVIQPQRVDTQTVNQEEDAVGIAGDSLASLVKILHIRSGRIVSADEFFVDEPITATEEILRAFLHQYYLGDAVDREIPRWIDLPVELRDEKPIESILEDRRGKKVGIRVPKKGRSRKLVELATRNAEVSLLERKRTSESNQTLLEDLQRTFRLRKYPRHIEGFDISAFHGAAPVGSQVTFIDGEADKTKYRIYNIKSVKGSNDFAMLREVFERRFRNVEEEDYPNLILVDGGKGQLRQIIEVLEGLGIQSVDVLSLAKEKTIGKGRKNMPERVFVPNQKNAVIMPTSSKVLHLLMRIRDEAHRFGVTRHRKRRSADTLKSVLDQIPGIGSQRQRALLRELKSLSSIQNASIEELSKVSGMNLRAAKSVKTYFDQRANEVESE